MVLGPKSVRVVNTVSGASVDLKSKWTSRPCSDRHNSDLSGEASYTALCDNLQPGIREHAFEVGSLKELMQWRS